MAALVALNLLVFAQVRHHDFVTWDDGPYVTDNTHVLAGLTWSGLAWAWTSATAPYWHPLTWMSHMLDVQLFGLNAGGHHVTSLALHIVNSILVCLLLYRLTESLARSLFVAALFAVHPLHVESVAWVAERKDVLSTMFLLLALFAYESYARRPNAAHYLLVVLAFAFGLAAKPMLVTLPLLLLLLDVWPLARWSRANVPHLLLEKVPLLALAVATSVATYLVQAQVGAVAAFDRLPLHARLANATVSYGKYMAKMIWPSGLAGFYPYPRVTPFWMILASGAALAGLSVVAVLCLRRWPFVFVGWLWYVVTLIPVIGVIQVGEQAMADRFTYMPLIGLFIVAAWTLPLLMERWRVSRTVAAGLASALVFANVVVARGQVTYWRDSHALWERALDVTADNYYAHSALGAILADEGHTEAARAHQVEALRIKPADPDALNELGKILVEQGNLPEAVRLFTAALQRNDRFAQAHHNLGMALMQQGAFRQAIEQFETALRLDPNLAKTHDGLGRALARSGETPSAVTHFREALRLSPDFVEARYNLGVALAEQGDFAEAEVEYRRLIALAPELPEARNNLALALAAQGKRMDAMLEFQEALRRWPTRVDLNYNIARLFLSQGSVQEAVAHLKAVLAVNPHHEETLRILRDVTKRQ